VFLILFLIDFKLLHQFNFRFFNSPSYVQFFNRLLEVVLEVISFKFGLEFLNLKTMHHLQVLDHFFVLFFEIRFFFFHHVLFVLEFSDHFFFRISKLLVEPLIRICWNDNIGVLLGRPLDLRF